MEYKRYKIAECPKPMWCAIPETCLKEKTITLNLMTQLHLFKDRRPEAVEYINGFLTHLGYPNAEKLVSWFWNEMPDNGFLQFDYATKILCFCLIDKKK